MCHDHRWNTWKSCLEVVFCADDEACLIIIIGLISPHISCFPCNQLRTSCVWILPLVNICISRRIQLFKRLIKYHIRCQRCRLAFILLLQDNVHLLMIRMYGLSWCRSWMSCCDLFSKCWREGILWSPLAHCFPRWMLKRLILWFWIDISTIIVIVLYCAEIVIETLILDRLSASPGARRKRTRWRSEVPWCHDLKRRQVISMKKIKGVNKGHVNVCIVNEWKCCVKERKH